MMSITDNGISHYARMIMRLAGKRTKVGHGSGR